MANKISFRDKQNDIEDQMDSDSDDNYTNREKSLIKKYRGRFKKDEESEEELFRFEEDDDVDDDNEENEKYENSDLDDKDDNDDIPDGKAWGKDKRLYYDTDFIDQDYNSYTEKEEEIALQEEKEAKLIQIRLAQQLNDSDFSLNFFTSKDNSNEQNDKSDKSLKAEILKKDLTDLSKRDKLLLLKKESPEFESLCNEYENEMNECLSYLEPFLKKTEDNSKIQESFLYRSVKVRYTLLQTYCANILYYLLLKSKKVSIKNHPIMKRLLKLRMLLLENNDLYISMVKPKMIAYLNDKYSNQNESKKMVQTVTNEVEKSKTEVQNSYKNPTMDITEDDKEAENESDIEEPVLDGFDAKRGITYQIAKNKGLTPHRRKDLRNPRVKHRNKFRKALIRRKGAIRTVRTEVKRYDGELSGIKATVKKGIKLK